MNLLAFIFLLATATSLHANLAVGVSSLESTDSKSLVTLKARNDFGQGVRNARAWVFLLDAEGKVVGQKAQWLASSDSTADLLANEQESEFTVTIETTAKPVKSQVTFSRILLADGSMPNPQKSVVPFEEAAP